MTNYSVTRKLHFAELYYQPLEILWSGNVQLYMSIIVLCIYSYYCICIIYIPKCDKYLLYIIMGTISLSTMIKMEGIATYHYPLSYYILPQWKCNLQILVKLKNSTPTSYCCSSSLRSRQDVAMCSSRITELSHRVRYYKCECVCVYGWFQFTAMSKHVFWIIQKFVMQTLIQNF